MFKVRFYFAVFKFYFRVFRRCFAGLTQNVIADALRHMRELRSEPVLSGADFGKSFGIGGIGADRGGLHLGQVGAQKGVGRQFFGKQRGNGGAPFARARR